MSQLQAILATIAALVALATLGGGLYAVFKSAADKVTIERLRGENADYLSRLNYVEPKLKDSEQSNKVLLELANPKADLEEIKRLLRAQGRNLADISRAVHVDPPTQEP